MKTKLSITIVLIFSMIFAWPLTCLAATKSVYINTKSSNEWEALLECSPESANKVVTGRPYASVKELSKRNKEIPKEKINEMREYIITVPINLSWDKKSLLPYLFDLGVKQGHATAIIAEQPYEKAEDLLETEVLKSIKKSDKALYNLIKDMIARKLIVA